MMDPSKGVKRSKGCFCDAKSLSSNPALSLKKYSPLYPDAKIFLETQALPKLRSRELECGPLLIDPKIVLIFRENLFGHSESTLLDSPPPHHVTFFSACDFWPVSYVISKHSNVNVGIYTGIFHTRFVAFRINMIWNRNSLVTLENNVTVDTAKF